MPYDEKVASRMRHALKGYGILTEKRMMGGLCFLLNGNMVGGASGTKEGAGRFMFRVGKDNHDRALKLPGGEPMIHGGRKMTGFFYVDADECTAPTLKRWVKLAGDFAAGLPPK